MANIDPLQTALDELLAERAGLDEDIRDLQRIIARRSPGGSSVQTGTPSDNGAKPAGEPHQRPAAAAPGDARREILEIMADGKIWKPSEIARIRGTSPNAATRALKRMLKEPEPPIRLLGTARYKLVSPKGDAQGSLSADTEWDENEREREGVAMK